MSAVFYSFRRCPYAIRARLALAAAGIRPELREVALKAKPPELLVASAKGTVPVLVDPEGPVLDESLAIMHWALAQHDPHHWWQGRSANEQAAIEALIAQNDGPFKHHLDRDKYAGRYGEQGLAEQPQHRRAAGAILQQWNSLLEAGGWLLGDRCTLADIALLPFVRQFRLADPEGFDASGGLTALRQWLHRFLESAELQTVLDEPWAQRNPWRSPSWLYHLALSGEWQQAQRQGSYRRSTRGRSLQEVGFIHLSQAHQLKATAARFYSDLPAGAVTLLVVDPAALRQQGLAVMHEPAPDTAELFPHLYGPLPLEAVVWSEPWRP
ncbi:MAG: DUF952 domain-containing protein [Cyanobacteriota bacterium]|nr:DUF952 domain-containing protein [Cyanobacteriota bacterium]